MDGIFGTYNGEKYLTDELLVIDDGGEPLVCAFIVDTELDTFMVRFVGHDGVIFETPEMKWLCLSREILIDLSFMIPKAAEIIDSMGQFYDEESGLFIDWQEYYILARPIQGPRII